MTTYAGVLAVVHFGWDQREEAVKGLCMLAQALLVQHQNQPLVSRLDQRMRPRITLLPAAPYRPLSRAQANAALKLTGRKLRQLCPAVVCLAGRRHRRLCVRKVVKWVRQVLGAGEFYRRRNFGLLWRSQPLPHSQAARGSLEILPGGDLFRLHNAMQQLELTEVLRYRLCENGRMTMAKEEHNNLFCELDDNRATQSEETYHTIDVYSIC